MHQIDHPAYRFVPLASILDPSGHTVLLKAIASVLNISITNGTNTTSSSPPSFTRPLSAQGEHKRILWSLRRRALELVAPSKLYECMDVEAIMPTHADADTYRHHVRFSTGGERWAGWTKL